MSTAHKETIRQFYEAFGRRDAETMGALYTDGVLFSDPVFPNLEGEEAKNMWKMLCGRSKDIRILVKDIEADDKRGSATWEAFYTFGQTGRKVHNIIQAQFEFQDGKIHRHTDRFDFWAWSRQALGITGVLLGWSPLLLKKVRKNAETALFAFSGTPR